MVILGTLIYYHTQRAFETAFIHKYSEEDRELYSIFVEYTYFFSFAASITGKLFYNYENNLTQQQITMLAVIFILLQTYNSYHHFRLRNLRPKPKDAKKVYLPQNWICTRILFPHYLSEIMSMLVLTIMS